MPGKHTRERKALKTLKALKHEVGKHGVGCSSDRREACIVMGEKFNGNLRSWRNRTSIRTFH